MFERLELQNIHYEASDREILKGVNLEVKRGERVAIVGRSGSGKTTLLRIILGLLEPSSGSVLINGKDLKSYSKEEICSMASMLSQRSHIFSRPLRDNLLLAKPDASDEEIVEALKKAGLEDFLKNRSLEDVLGEDGSLISGGERARIALSRLILRDPELVILDEPLEGVDKEVEMSIVKNIEKFVKNKTLILVSHRLSMLSLAEEYVVLEEGIITEKGKLSEHSSDSLLKKFIDAEKKMTKKFMEE